MKHAFYAQEPNADFLVGSKYLPYIQIAGVEALGGLPTLNLLDNCVFLHCLCVGAYGFSQVTECLFPKVSNVCAS